MTILCTGLTAACYTGANGRTPPPLQEDDSGEDSSGDGEGNDGDEALDGDPGRVTVHRLNNTEYNNTVRDLLGTSLTPAADFPADDYSYGFDNIAEVLSVSPVQLELYQRAAHDLAAEAMRGPIDLEDHRIEAEDVGGTTGQNVGGTAWVFNLPGQLDATLVLPVEGTYAIQVRAWADQAGPELAKLEVSIDGQSVEVFDVGALVDAPQIYEVNRDFSAGAVGVTAAFINDFFIPEQNLDRNLYVDWVTIRGPLDATGTTPIRDGIMICEPDPAEPEPCVREIVTAFGERAWRRPLSDEEISNAMGLFDLVITEGGDHYEGLQLVIEALLSSPNFLFRFEIDPDPTSLEPRPLNGYELATRLSYFLWSSMPDDELFAHAAAGDLHEPEQLEAQIERMLADPKADALVDNFAAQWLYLRGLEDHTPNYDVYPEFDDSLRDAMIQQTKLFFGEFLTEDLSVLDMLTGDFAFLDARLAAHYDIPFSGSGFEKVSAAGTGRSGLLGQGSILTVTSHPDRTSPVKRGKWVLEELLCSAPPPPPPGVEGLEPDGPATGSVREQLEQHRTDPSCFACHQAMDPIGFGLEHFDAIGVWRDMDGEYEIDSSGVLPGGDSFDGAEALAEVLARDPRFTRCMAQKMLIYALGRGLETTDNDEIDRIHDEFLAEGSRLKHLISLVATSDIFLYRRGEPVQ